MKVCLAALSSKKKLQDEFHHCKYMLESFYSIPKWFVPVLKGCEFFLLDSGAFTFMNKRNGNIDFDDYLTRYIDFINANDIEHFFELDVDSVIGIEKVEKLRVRLESETGKKSIPVWHKSRGKEYFVDMCRSYDYVAIGGIAAKEIKPAEYKDFRWFIDTAHSYGAKIHGLGFTNINGIKLYDFDSVDSTRWVSGSRFGIFFEFDGEGIKALAADEAIKRTDLADLNRHNLREWVKFQQYADLHY
jgi:hypothetical protein